MVFDCGIHEKALQENRTLACTELRHRCFMYSAVGLLSKQRLVERWRHPRNLHGH